MLVSRQSNYYDGGAYSVEIARDLDYAGPGMLAGDWPEEGDYDDPRDAAQAAAQLAERWGEQEGWERWGMPGDPMPITVSMNAMVYPTVKDGMTPEEARAWAQDRYDRMPKCDRCGGPLPDEKERWHLLEEQDYLGDDAPEYCSENCAELAYDDLLREQQEIEYGSLVPRGG